MEAVSIVQKAVATRSTLPVLDGILIEADTGINRPAMIWKQE